MITRRGLMAGAGAAAIAAAMPVEIAAVVPVTTFRGVPIFADESTPTLAEWATFLDRAQPPKYFLVSQYAVDVIEAQIA